MGILAVLLAVLAALFWISEQAAGRKLFSIIPMLVFCYFVSRSARRELARVF